MSGGMEEGAAMERRERNLRRALHVPCEALDDCHDILFGVHPEAVDMLNDALQKYDLAAVEKQAFGKFKRG